jgi:hypothetical protein
MNLKSTSSTEVNIPYITVFLHFEKLVVCFCIDLIKNLNWLICPVIVQSRDFSNVCGKNKPLINYSKGVSPLDAKEFTSDQ